MENLTTLIACPACKSVERLSDRNWIEKHSAYSYYQIKEPESKYEMVTYEQVEVEPEELEETIHKTCKSRFQEYTASDFIIKIDKDKNIKYVGDYWEYNKEDLEEIVNKLKETNL